jgi:hypothetical protein
VKKAKKATETSELDTKVPTTKKTVKARDGEGSNAAARTEVDKPKQGKKRKVQTVEPLDSDSD